MNWQNIKLIFLREVRDQLRDRRTLFMIFVLPLLMYPLLGMSILQVSQFLRDQPTKILLLGLPAVADLPQLVSDNRFDAQWLSDPAQDRLFELDLKPPEAAQTKLQDGSMEDWARQAVQGGQYQAVVIFPNDFADQLARFRIQMRQVGRSDGGPIQAEASVPNPVIYYNTANEKSQLAYSRIAGVLRSWAEAIGKQNLKESRLPAEAGRPFEFTHEDVSEAQQRRAAMWSKILPFVVLLWALTGAFYPAVDLCAGEKERGTLETLLCSPAQRGEIVTGKLLTVMIFSLTTSVLNLASMGLTGALVIAHLPNTGEGMALGMPPLAAQLWLLLALVPVSALFSALCLALAAFARSSKEGQYYLMPLVLITLPLVMLPMGPGMELTLGNSLIPLTGLVLLLRTLLEGNYTAAWPYVAPVVGVTLACCLLAVRWAVEQFNKESVLFRESERLDVGLWLRHLVRDRGNTPTSTEAIFCGVLIVTIGFFMSFAIGQPTTFHDIAVAAIVTQLVVIVTPALLMTIMLTRSPGQTLLLRKPALWTLPSAMLLAVALHPALMLLGAGVKRLYPISSGMQEATATLERALGQAPHWWQLLLLVAVVPAICEELAFRGFILSGLRHLGHKWWAIGLSSLMFAFAHTFLQQSLVACVAGFVIGYIAVQTGSILPGMLFHFTNNALPLVVAQFQESGRLGSITQRLDQGHDFIYAWWVFALGIVMAGVLLAKFAGLSYRKSEEEALQEAISHQAAGVGA